MGETNTVKCSDGTVLQIARLPEVNETTWGEMKTYLENNPDVAKKLQNFAKNPEAMRGWLQTQAIAEYYQVQLEAGNSEVRSQLNDLHEDAELGHVFDEIKERGLGAAMKYWDDEELMLKISEKMGGVPGTIQPTLKKIKATPLSMHEAAKNGDIKAVNEYLKKQAVDAQDLKGISPLGYAVGSNRIAVVKALIDAKADPSVVDANQNSALHYAAGYGRKELVEYFIQAGADINRTNLSGKTPISVARVNGHQACIDLLEQKGAKGR